MNSPDPMQKKQLFTKRFLLALVGLVAATVLCLIDKLTGEAWVFAFATALAGHRAEDIAKAFRKQP